MSLTLMCYIYCKEMINLFDHAITIMLDFMSNYCFLFNFIGTLNDMYYLLLF